MKKLALLVLCVIFSFSFVNCVSTTSTKISNQQIQDLAAFGYPIIYEKPFIDKNGHIHIKYKNISSKTIHNLNFVYNVQENELHLNTREFLDPNESGESIWKITGNSENGIITRIELFVDGQSEGISFNREQAMVMLSEKNYNAVSKMNLENVQKQITPSADYSVYIEKPLTDVVNGKYYYSDSYEAIVGMIPGGGRNNIRPYDKYNTGRYWFNFSSYVYIQDAYSQDTYTGGGIHSFILKDDEGNQLVASPSNMKDSRKEISDLYRLWENSDFDLNKKYHVNYRISKYRHSYNDSIDRYTSVRLDSIEGLLTYDEIKDIERKEKEEAEKIALQKNIDEINSAYNSAIKNAGVEKIVNYIEKYDSRENRDYFNQDSYAEIARRITNDRNVEFKEMDTASNPYAFDIKTVYYCPVLPVQQFLKGKVFVYSSRYKSDDELMVLSVPDISKIENYISNAYLKYTGITTVSMSNGGTREIATFSLIFSF